MVMEEYDYSKYALCSDAVPPKVEELTWTAFLSTIK
jgi:hypothetical protein